MNTTDKKYFCKKCHAEIDKNLKKCPNCGAKTGGKGKIFIGIAIAFVALIIIISIIPDTEDTSKSTSSKSSSTVTAAPTATPIPAENKKTNSNKVLDLFSSLGESEDIPFTISPKAADTLTAHPELFTENKNVNLSAYTDLSLDYRQLIKNINNHGDYLIHINNATVVSIYEDTLDNQTLSQLEVEDYDGNRYLIYSLTAYNDIFEGDNLFDVYALPLAMTTYKVVGGNGDSSMQAIVCAAAYIKKFNY